MPKSAGIRVALAVAAIALAPACARRRELPRPPAPPSVVVSAAGISFAGERIDDAPGDADLLLPALTARVHERRAAWDADHPNDEPDPIDVELPADTTCKTAMSVLAAVASGRHRSRLKLGGVPRDVAFAFVFVGGGCGTFPGWEIPIAFHADRTVEARRLPCFAPFDKAPPAEAGALVKGFCDEPDCLYRLLVSCDRGVPFRDVLEAYDVARERSPKLALSSSEPCVRGLPEPQSAFPEGDRPKSKPRRADVRWDVEVHGPLRADAVKAFLTDNTAVFNGCYQRALEDEPALAGDMKGSITINKAGGVVVATVPLPALDSGRLASCVRAALARLTFPPPESAGAKIDYVVHLHAR